MKKILLFFAIIATLPTLAQTEVNRFFPGVGEGITYYLPDTRIEVTVNAACVTHTPGEFSRYAEKYLRIDNAITAATTHWEMTGADVTTSGIPNSEKMYTVRTNNSTACNVSLCENGIIIGVNIKSPVEAAKEEEPVQRVTNHIDARQYMTEEMLQATSTAKLAELTAKEIYAIRESKLALTRGEADSMPTDGQAMQIILDELNKQETALTELFTGRTDTTYHSCLYMIDPVLGCDTTKAVLFRFSRKLGFVDKDDLSGEPVYYNLRDMKTVHIPTPEELEKKKVVKKEGVCYNIPGKANFSLFTRSRKLYNSDIYIAQFGVTELLTKDLFNKKSTIKVLFNTATGGILNIEKQ